MTQTASENRAPRQEFGKVLADAREMLARDSNIDRLAGEWLGLCDAGIGRTALFFAAGAAELVGWRIVSGRQANDISSWRISGQSSLLYKKIMSDRQALIFTAQEFAAALGPTPHARALVGDTGSICLVPLVIEGNSAGMFMFASDSPFAAADAEALRGMADLFGARVMEIYRAEAQPLPRVKTSTITLSDEEETKIRRVLRKIENLPAMPIIAGKVLEMVEDAGTSAKDLQRLINNDPILAAKILKVANSSYYCGGMDVATLTEAIVILGFNTLRSLVIAASMRSLYVQKPSRQGAETAARFAARQKTLWEHSVACAAVSRKLAKKINYANPETAFVAGLLHDIGRLVMFKEMPAESERWLAERNPAADTPQPPAQKILASEKEIFSFDHSQVGTAVARKWQLAEELTSAIAGHHFAETATPPTPLGAIVDFANTICLKNRIGPIAMPALNLEEELARLPLALTAQDLKTVQDDLSRMLSAEALFL